MVGSVSPPRIKRRRLPDAEGPHQPEQGSPTPSHRPVGGRYALHVYSWNVNGIGPFVQASITHFFKPKSQQQQTREDDGTSPKASLRDFLRRNSWPQLLFLQEVKINPNDAQTIGGVKNAVRRQPNEPQDAPEYEAHFCLPSDKHNARGFGRKVYGVCSIVRTDFASDHVERVRPVSWDAEGRFLIVETRAGGPLTSKLAVINVYAVNGTDHPYRDPQTGAVVGTRHDRKLEVHRLLQRECKALHATGFHVILAGDINVARAAIDGHPNLRTFPARHCLNRADFEEKFIAPPSSPRVGGQDDQRARRGPDAAGAADEDNNDGGNDSRHQTSGLRMIDTFRHLHPTKRGYTYYPRTGVFGDSCDRVDMILASPGLRPHLTEAGMCESPSERGPSDHVPLYAKFLFPSLGQNEHDEKNETLPGP